jgi:hypothetical protein
MSSRARWGEDDWGMAPRRSIVTRIDVAGDGEVGASFGGVCDLRHVGGCDET